MVTRVTVFSGSSNQARVQLAIGERCDWINAELAKHARKGHQRPDPYRTFADTDIVASWSVRR